MKQFDVEEQQCIDHILNIGQSSNGVLTNVFADVLFGNGVAVNLDSGDILYNHEKYKNIDDILSIQRIIIKRALLIKYLEEHNYIYIINDSPETIPFIGDKFNDSIVQKLPTDIADIIRRTTYRIYADSSLQAFTNQNFKTTDEIIIEESKLQTEYAKIQSEESKKQTQSAQKQTILSWIALVCAIITAIASIVVPIKLNKCSKVEEYQDGVLHYLNQTNTTIVQSTNGLKNDMDSIKNIGSEIVKQNEILIKTNEK